jgi:hypothetical protein
MGTRALIGYLDTDGDLKLTTTYNHYDGYPSNLGNGLETFYDDDAKAKEIASVGYISFLNGETGEWENTSSNTRPAKVIQLPDNFNDAMEKIAEIIDGMGADYGYIWDNENGEWITIRNSGINGMYKDLSMSLAHLKGKFEIFPEQPEQTMEGQEGEGDELYDWISDMLKYKSYEEVAQILRQTLANALEDEELANKVKADYEGIEDLEKTELEEYLKRQWQRRAGIIK